MEDPCTSGSSGAVGERLPGWGPGENLGHAARDPLELGDVGSRGGLIEYAEWPYERDTAASSCYSSWSCSAASREGFSGSNTDVMDSREAGQRRQYCDGRQASGCRDGAMSGTSDRWLLMLSSSEMWAPVALGKPAMATKTANSSSARSMTAWGRREATCIVLCL